MTHQGQESETKAQDTPAEQGESVGVLIGIRCEDERDNQGDLTLLFFI